VINKNLHQQPVALDRATHHNLRLRLPMTDWTVASRLNSMVLAAVEFGDACREYPVVFVPAGEDASGKPQVVPVAIFGLAQQENLYLDGPNWRASYMPALLRLYPFAMARVDEKTFAMCLDMAWPGVSQTEGEPLFAANGEPTDVTQSAKTQLEQAEIEVQRTRFVGQKLQELELLQPMRFDATLPGGEKLTVDGFLTVNEEKFKALPDAAVLDLQRNGFLGLIYAHLISLGNMRRLIEWRVLRANQAAAAAGNGAVAPA
jgi:hypothetical protein